MKLEIPIKNEEGYNCVDNILSAVAHWAGIDYELMFSESWGFAYNPQQGKNLTLGKCLNSCFENRDKLIEKYHGLKLNFCTPINTNDLLDIIKSELNKKKPVSINMDVFWCAWFKQGYQIYHAPHYVLVEEYDEISEILYCKDGEMACNGAQLSISDLEKGSDTCLTFSFLENSKYDNDWRKIIKNAVDKLYSTNAFDAMRRFSIDFSNNFDIKKEVYGYEAFVGKAPLFKEISTIGACRKKFAKTLQYLSRTHNLQLYEISEMLQQVGDRWGSIFGMLMKSYYLPDNISLITKIASKINKIADYEEQIANMLLEAVQTDYSVAPLRFNNSPHIKPIRINEYTYIDFENYANNQGFSNSLSYDCKAEFSHGGKYFLTNGLPHNNNLVISDMNFLFPTISDNLNDNISCTGQIIPINLNNYFCIMILGCSELGSHSEYLDIRFEDGTIEEIPLEFTNWFISEPKYNEFIAWSGQCVIRSKFDVTVNPLQVHLFAKNYFLKTKGLIKELRLPYCPNIHIFAITLGR